MRTKKYIGSLLVGLFIILFFLLGCSGFQSNTNPNPVESTLTSIVVEQTVISLQQTKTAMSRPANVSQPEPENLSSTVQPVVVATIAPAPVIPQEEPTQPLITPQSPDFDTWKQTARILLYEDIVGVPKVRRFVKDTLDKIALPYTDIGNAQGWLKDRLLYGGEGGQPWDLIIFAVENRAQISGEFFDYLSNWMDQGTSVIIEAWYLDKISEGKIRPILQECGIYIKNYSGGGSNMDLVLWPLVDTVHPILTEPNNYLSFTKGAYFWDKKDLGDMMDLTGNGDAMLLVGRKVTDKTHNGALAVCMGGQLTMQTFSSHTYPREIMEGAWENYIINALKVRYSGH